MSNYDLYDYPLQTDMTFQLSKRLQTRRPNFSQAEGKNSERKLHSYTLYTCVLHPVVYVNYYVLFNLFITTNSLINKQLKA
jgi:hypothetical protein